ncbi:MAG: ABC transporter substrate-binding protein [Fimbriiglobus sp.]
MRWLAFLPFLLLVGCTKSSERVVVYSAQDQEYAERIFEKLKPRLKLEIAPKFDTEANKSVSLVAELQAEANQPRADVHWNNEILGTIRLARAGVYEEYTSPESKLYPPSSWNPKFQMFAERARVLIVNTNLIAEADRPSSIFDLTLPKFRGRVAMAKPQFGTTATHAACLFEILGEDAAKAFFDGLHTNQVQLLAGNKAVAVSVGKGDVAVGMTDSDDAMIEILAGKPVVMILPDAVPNAKHPRLGTVYLPNTVAIIAKCPNPDGARRVMNLLLTAETETALSQGGGYQLPLRTDLAELRSKTLKTANAPSQRAEVDFEKAADLWDKSQAYLREKFAR